MSVDWAVRGAGDNARARACLRLTVQQLAYMKFALAGNEAAQCAQDATEPMTEGRLTPVSIDAVTRWS